jgi:hypothetical protein
MRSMLIPLPWRGAILRVSWQASKQLRWRSTCASLSATARETALAGNAALKGAWDADLHEIIEEINSEYAKANSAAH